MFFLLNLAPVLYSPWMAANIFTERYLYLPSAGLCWGLGWAGAKLWREMACGGFADHPSWRPRVWRPVAIISALIIVFLCTLRIVRRNRDWHDNERFYKATIATQPDAYIMRLNLAGIYLDRDDLDNAERELVAADKLAPDYPLILNNLALLNMKRKRYDEAQGYLIRSLLKDSKEPQPHLYLGELYTQIGQTAYAEKEFRTAVMLSPLSLRAHLRLADFYFDHGRLAEAEKEYQESLRVTRTPRGYWGVGLVSWREGRYAEAESAFRQAEALDPYSGRAHIMLGLLYTDTKRDREALEELQTGLKSEPDNRQALEALKKLQSEDSSRGGSNPSPAR
jgi:tetratricopeptide (TPR) repeat protein